MTRNVTAKDGAAAIAMLDRERKSATAMDITLRRCAGSSRFGIEAHEAPVSDFPKQPSRKDGLGVMCSEHWKTYVKGLREARLAAAGTKPQAARPKAAAKPRAKKATAKPSAKADEIAKAERLIAEVDAMPGGEHVKRVGDDDVQAAMETAASARGAMTAD
jgi:hypothetical protein